MLQILSFQYLACIESIFYCILCFAYTLIHKTLCPSVYWSIRRSVCPCLSAWHVTQRHLFHLKQNDHPLDVFFSSLSSSLMHAYQRTLNEFFNRWLSSIFFILYYPKYTFILTSYFLLLYTFYFLDIFLSSFLSSSLSFSLSLFLPFFASFFLSSFFISFLVSLFLSFVLSFFLSFFLCFLLFFLSLFPTFFLSFFLTCFSCFLFSLSFFLSVSLPFLFFPSFSFLYKLFPILLSSFASSPPPSLLALLSLLFIFCLPPLIWNSSADQFISRINESLSI